MKILLPVDGTELSLHETRFALRLVREGLRASFVLANVQEPASLYELVVSRDPDLIAAASIEAGEHLMASARACVSSRFFVSEPSASACAATSTPIVPQRRSVPATRSRSGRLGSVIVAFGPSNSIRPVLRSACSRLRHPGGSRGWPTCRVG